MMAALRRLLHRGPCAQIPESSQKLDSAVQRNIRVTRQAQLAALKQFEHSAQAQEVVTAILDRMERSRHARDR